jgi:hypothetical protein
MVAPWVASEIVIDCAAEKLPAAGEYEGVATASGGAELPPHPLQPEIAKNAAVRIMT